jgi:SAM-dependent methyltransferase
MIFSYIRERLQGRLPSPNDSDESSAPHHRRFLSGQVLSHAERLIRAAKDRANQQPGLDYLYDEPVDGSAGNPRFFSDLYQVLNLLQAMGIRAGGRVLEVGSGSGWVTEILMGLGFEVAAIEPNADMMAVAQARITAAIQHHRLEPPPRVGFHCCTLEENPLPDGAFDAVLFHAAWHHVVDEERGLAECFRLLRPGGVLGVSAAAWNPTELSSPDLTSPAAPSSRADGQELAGTLDNTFTADDLDYVLRKHGFDDICRYHGVNGLFPARMGGLTIAQAAQSPLDGSNTLTAIKPDMLLFAGPTTVNAEAATKAEITILDAWMDTAGKAQFRLCLTNRGETAWLHNRKTTGWVRLGLWQRMTPDPASRREAEGRVHLPRTVLPGQQLEVGASFTVPANAQGTWYLDLVNEGLFWFSQRGTVPASVKLTALPVRP